jgi:hypothetical protein
MDKIYTVGVTVSEMLCALDAACDRRGVEYKDLPDSIELDVEAQIDSDTADTIAGDRGYVHVDDAHRHLDPNLVDLAEGLRELIAGDRAMASILLARAFDAWPAAARVAEDILNNRTVHDRRQLTLLAA